MDSKEIGAVLVALREQCQFSQTAVSDYMRRCGFDWNQMKVSRVERGERELRLLEAAPLAALYGITVTDFLSPEKVDASVVADAVLGRQVRDLVNRLERGDEDAARKVWDEWRPTGWTGASVREPGRYISLDLEAKTFEEAIWDSSAPTRSDSDLEAAVTAPSDASTRQGGE